MLSTSGSMGLFQPNARCSNQAAATMPVSTAAAMRNGWVALARPVQGRRRPKQCTGRASATRLGARLTWQRDGQSAAMDRDRKPAVAGLLQERHRGVTEDETK